VLAEATLVAGRAAMELQDHAAIATLGEAATTAMATGQDAIGIEAWARRAFVEVEMGDAAEPLAGLDIVEALASRTRSAFARALLANSVGNVELERTHREQARKAFERALVAAREVTGPGAVELVNVRMNLAVATEDPAERDRLFVEAHEALARLLGPDHPQTLLVEWVRVMKSVTDPHDASEALSKLCSRYELHPALSGRRAMCMVELADVRDVLGDRAGARAAIAQALDLGAATVDDVAEAKGYAALWSGDATGAVTAFEAALATHPVASGESWYQTYTRTKIQLGLARALLAAHRDAAAPLAAATESLTVLARDQQAAAIERRLAEARELTASRK
jgi:hypothetical protein